MTSRPLECAHVLGTLLRDLGPDYVLWGTDSLLWGNPQWQIEAFRNFQIPDELVEGHGYPKITPEDDKYSAKTQLAFGILMSPESNDCEG